MSFTPSAPANQSPAAGICVHAGGQQPPGGGPVCAPATAGSAAERGSRQPAPLWATEQVHRFWRHASSCLASLALHAFAVIVLGLLFIPHDGRGRPMALSASMADGTHDAETLETEEFLAEPAPSPSENESSLSPLAQLNHDLAQSIAAAAQTTIAPAQPETSTAERPLVNVEATQAIVPFTAGALAGREIFGATDADVTGALGGRGQGQRMRLALEGGGTADSEDAVSRGLRWLQAHQLVDGGWCFDLTQGPCQGRCSDSGSEVSTTGATALALLAFLGRGETHLEGDYQETVKRGLYYLTGRMRISPQGGDLRGEGGGNMYSHGIAAIALCEAYAMTHDKSLGSFAQQAIDFIVFAQHSRGGWRYKPGMPGDTTVTGWQIIALKSGQMGYLRVPFETIERAGQFLDSVQTDRGARYMYQPHLREGRELTTTSVGLLCRMYTGWPKSHAALRKGVETLTREGPSMLGRNANMYYNYYATQIMHQYGGRPWQAWNDQMREFLVRTQSNDAHESGSWYFDGGQAKPGGRLYVTAMAIMTLEVYYRHLPLYESHAVDR